MSTLTLRAFGLSLLIVWTVLTVPTRFVPAQENVPRDSRSDEPVSLPVEAPDDIRHAEPSFFVHCDVNRADRVYRQGESLSISLVSEQDAYAYVLYQQADGQVFQIFPNSAQRNNRVAAKQVVTIPAADDQFRWRIGPPYGKEIVKVIASKEPIANLNDPALRTQRFNPVSREQVTDAAVTLRQSDPTVWAEAAVEITTVAERQTEVAQGRRVGVFFGTSIYQFDAEAREATEGQWSPNLACPANNAQTLAALLKNMGQLESGRVFVNEQATKANMEEAITRWLPSITKPGDTVFIFIGGHGGQIPDDNGDESDGLDEWILPHDYVGITILNVLMNRHKEGKLDPALLPRVENLVGLVKRSVSTNDPDFLVKADAVLARHTGVSDDLFGHWLQRLAGRQVVVILDICHAGGFAKDEKSLVKGGFDFLDGELSRLKDLGQPDSVLYAACGAQQESYAMRVSDAVLAQLAAEAESKELVQERVGVNLAVFSYYVVESLVTLPPPVDIEKSRQHAQAGMRQYFDTVNEILRNGGDEPLKPHDPLLFNYSQRPVLLKP